MLTTKNLKTTPLWAVRPDGTIIGLVDAEPKTPQELYADIQKLVEQMQATASSQSLSRLDTRLSLVEQVDVPAVDSRIKVLEGKPVATPQAVADAVSRIATLEAKPTPVIPKPATTAPPPVALQGSAGTSTEYALKDHTHEARTQRKVVTLDGNGLSTWTFAKPFENKPSLNYMVFQPTGTGKVVVDAVEWVMVAGKFAGVKVSGSRSQKLPQSPPVNALALLGNVITGVNNLISGLSGYDIFAGGNLNGVEVHLSAGDQI